jgi:hypothetical protein
MKDYVGTRCKAVIVIGSDCKIKIHDNNIVTYSYATDAYFGEMEFGLLSEVGEHWKVVFEAYIEKYKLKFETVDTLDYYGERIIVDSMLGDL